MEEIKKGGGAAGSTFQACASCKHQRKKCNPETCTLAPFFPAAKGKEFLAVHKLFGVSNVQKIIQSIDAPEKRKDAVETLIWEADRRQVDPVYGCYADFSKLQVDNDKLRAYARSLEEQVQALKHQLEAQYSSCSNGGRLDHPNNYNVMEDFYNGGGGGPIGPNGIGLNTSDHMIYMPGIHQHMQVTTSQFNQAYSFNDHQLTTNCMKTAELMDQFNIVADIKPLDQLGQNISMDMDAITLCADDTSWEEAR